MSSIDLLELTLEIETIIIGERVKGGIFRPCQNTIPSSTIEGALKHWFGIISPAVGFFEEGTYVFNEFTYSVKDKALNISKMPIITEYLQPQTDGGKITAKILLPVNEAENNISEGDRFQMGALKSKGFGKSEVIEIKKIQSETKQGFLKVKLFKDEAKEFGVHEISPIYGYLFYPDNFSIGGIYKKALFPNSLVKAPEILLKGVTYYDK